MFISEVAIFKVGYGGEKKHPLTPVSTSFLYFNF
jgi:hypothetical protein